MDGVGPASWRELSLLSGPPQPAVAQGRYTTPEKARAAAQEFESVFLNTMLQQMFTAAEGDGPLGGRGSSGVWRSFLTDEYARNFAKAGGIGLADHIYRAMLAQQEVQAP